MGNNVSSMYLQEEGRGLDRTADAAPNTAADADATNTTDAAPANTAAAYAAPNTTADAAPNTTADTSAVPCTTRCLRSHPKEVKVQTKLRMHVVWNLHDGGADTSSDAGAVVRELC